MLDLLNFKINFDWSWIENLGNLPIYFIMWHFIKSGGWVLFAVILLYGGWINFVYWRQKKWGAKQSHVFLAIDVPKDSIQTPKADENIFTALAGAHMPLDWHEKKFSGQYQLGFSLELVSIDGFIQYIIRTPVQFRHMVESAIYSQYPEAEITEVNDYTADINVEFPSDEYNIWGADLVLTKKDYYPIRTYLDFKEELDNEFKDPLAAVIEVMSSIGKGEQIWLQMICSPTDIGWQKEGIKFVNKKLGIEEPAKMNKLNSIIELPLKAVQFFNEHVLGWGGVSVEDKKKEARNMMFLPPTDKREVEEVMKKIDKICFKCKYRLAYFGKKEVFKKGLGVAGMMGAIKQFGFTSLNSFKPGENKTQAKLFMKKQRLAGLQNEFLANYKGRNGDTCEGKYLLNVEELATLFHFPNIELKSPLVKKTESRRSHAPMSLPTYDDKTMGIGLPVVEKQEQDKDEKLKNVDYDNDYFEKRFAVDKTGKTDKKRKQEILKELEEKENNEPAKGQKEKQLEVENNKDDFESNFKSDDDNDAPGNLPFV